MNATPLIRTVPVLEVWKELLGPTVSKLKLPNEEYHMVLYTDGGCRPPPNGFGGCGIHGYLYHYQQQKFGYGTSGFVPTDRGYQNNTYKKDDPTNISILGYIDGVINIVPNSSNNMAEAMALYKALELVKEIKPKSAHFKLDSEYALNGATKWLKSWVSSGWKNNNGADVANKEIWKMIHQLLTEVVANTSLSWEWVKGHSDSVGNNKADHNATAAINAAFNGIGIDLIEVTQPSNYWSPNNPYNRFLTEAYWYFSADNPLHKHNERCIYHIGNHGSKTKNLGRADPETIYGVVAIKEPEPILEDLRSYILAKRNPGSSQIVVATLTDIFRPSIHQELSRYSTRHLFRHPENPLIITPAKVKLCETLDPPLLAYEAVDELNKLETMLFDYMDGVLQKTDVVLLTDITDVLYEAVPDPKKKDVVKYKTRLGDSEDTAKVTVSVEYSRVGNEKETAPIVLTVGIDLPRRNLISALAGPTTRVYVVTWPMPGNLKAFKFATIIDTGEECGIWAGVYGNVRVVTDGNEASKKPSSKK